MPFMEQRWPTSLFEAAARVALLGCLLTAGCGEDDEPVGDQILVRGIVRDEATNDPLKGARVLFTADTLETAEDRTNEDGEYTVTVEARSLNARVEASKDGYQTRTVSVFVDDVTVQIDVELPRAN
jgi:hypothetical protein